MEELKMGVGIGAVIPLVLVDADERYLNEGFLDNYNKNIKNIKNNREYYVIKEDVLLSN
jgi:hypothetical protein